MSSLLCGVSTEAPIPNTVPTANIDPTTAFVVFSYSISPLCFEMQYKCKRLHFDYIITQKLQRFKLHIP